MKNLRLVFYVFVAALTLHPHVSSGAALFVGVFFALVIGNPIVHLTRPWPRKLLSWSVIGLGAEMDLAVVARVGLSGLSYTFLGIAGTFLFGWLISRLLKVPRTLWILITAGTAICGGSAIAAVAPVLKADNREISVALGTVFILNAVALFIFPAIGHSLNLSQAQFGFWSALAIHDTSSVVGAALQYGNEALELGTTVKLARALWIVPVTLIIAMFVATKEQAASAQKKWPWFILGFLSMAALVTIIPDLKPVGHHIGFMAKRTLVLTLFIIGSNLDRATLKTVGIRPLLLGVALWVIAASATLTAILFGWIK